MYTIINILAVSLCLGFASPETIDAKFKMRTMLAKPVDRATFWKTVDDKFGSPPSAAVDQHQHEPT